MKNKKSESKNRRYKKAPLVARKIFLFNALFPTKQKKFHTDVGGAKKPDTLRWIAFSYLDPTRSGKAK